MSEPETLELPTIGVDQSFVTELQSITLQENDIVTEFDSECKQSDTDKSRETNEYKQTTTDGKNAEHSTATTGTNYQEPMVKKENNKNDISETIDCEKSVSQENDMNSRFVTKNDSQISDDFVVQEMVDERKGIPRTVPCLNGSKEINCEETIDDKKYCNILLNNVNNPIGTLKTLKDTQNTVSNVNQHTENVTEDRPVLMNEGINVNTEKDNYSLHVAPEVECLKIENSIETMGSEISTNNEFKEMDNNFKTENDRDLWEQTEMKLVSSNLNVTEIKNTNNEEGEESILSCKPQIFNPQEEDNECTIGMSSEEEMEIRMIIEMAEREYAKDANNENKNNFQQNGDYPFEEEDTAETEYATSDYVQLKNDSGLEKVGVVFNNAIDAANDKGLKKEQNSISYNWKQRTSRYKWIRGQDTESRPTSQPGQALVQQGATSESEEMNRSTGNSSRVNLEDKELIMELVAIALGEKTVPPDYQPQVSSGDKRGEIISEFVHEYFEKLKSKPKQCNSSFYNQSQVNVPDSCHLKAPKTKIMDFSAETSYKKHSVKKNHSLKIKDRLNTFRSDIFPVIKSRVERESRSVEMEDTPMGGKGLSLKWGFDDDKVVYKPVEGGFEKKPQESEDKKSKNSQRKTERKRACSWNQLPMNEKNGDFYLNRSLVPVDLYQEGLDEYRWNPTMVVNEICSKSGWAQPMYRDMDYNEQGFLGSVTVKDKVFYSQKRGKTKNLAKHFASTRFLTYLGFRFIYNPYPHHTVIPPRPRSASDTTEDYKPRRGHSQSSPSKSRRCHTNRRSRSASWETDRTGSSYSGRRSQDEENSSGFSRDNYHKHRVPSPPTPPPRRRERPSHDREYSPPHNREYLPSHHRDYSPSHNRDYLPSQHREYLPSHHREYSPERQESSRTKKSSGRPPKWDRLDDIPSFVPQRRASPPGYRHSSHEAVPPQPPVQHKCRCKLSFPHPSVHPWRYMMKGKRSTES